MTARPLNILIAPGMLPAHVIPYLEPARLLCASGHRVYFYAERYARAMVKPTGCRFIESAAPDATERFLRQRALPGQTRAAQAFTEAVAGDLPRRLRRLRIDVGLVDQMNLGAALALAAADLPWASLAISPAILSPRIDDWPSRISTDRLRRSLGLPAVADSSLVQGISPHVFFLPWIPELDLWPPPPASQHVGCVYAPIRPAPELRAWLAPRRGKPRVLISLSTAPDPKLRAELDGFVARVLEALARVPVRAVLTLGNVGKVEVPASASPDIRIERFVDHSAILDRIDVVLNQAGWGTISRALTAGVPMLMVPFERDQMANALLCQRAGLGIASASRDLSAAAVADALHSLATPGNPFARRAAQQRAAWRRGGPARVARRVARLAGRS